MPSCKCKPDLQGEHDPDCPFANGKPQPKVLTPHPLATEKWICPECSGVENLSPLMSSPAHRHGGGGTQEGPGLVYLRRLP